MIRVAIFATALFWASAAVAIDLSLPVGSRLISDRSSKFDSYDLPIGPWDLGAVPTDTREGRVERQSWRVPGGSITTLQLMAPLREQLAQAGLELVFECADTACGGFDFRFDIEVIPTPDMYVDIRDYRFLAARNGEDAISILVSRSRSDGYIQVIQVAPSENGALKVASDAERLTGNPDDTADFSTQLIEFGHATLSDLEFATGTAELANSAYDSLEDLAAFMAANPSASVALVGHTDATGALDVNIALSKRRAEAVRALLTARHGIAPDRIAAEGMGYLSPRATNLTQTGRERNRRVEAVLLSLD